MYKPSAMFTFLQEYLVDMKNAAFKAGKIGSTGCPELPF
jgi:hypothetical protein